MYIYSYIYKNNKKNVCTTLAYANMCCLKYSYLKYLIKKQNEDYFTHLASVRDTHRIAVRSRCLPLTWC